ncbi:MAG TPA: hypothetical protein VJ728_07445, partial [Candidatus Binataceae bacterium]|nr:hypothetical protein [Candidatus Binataceae bacterium]
MILWIHVLCGVVWVGACAAFILAVLALAGEPQESYALTARIAPQIGRLSVAMAIVIPLTGMGNLFYVAVARGSALPAEFVGIVAVKVVLLAIMVLASLAAARAVRVVNSSPGSESIIDVRRVASWYGLIVGAGIVALG